MQVLNERSKTYIVSLGHVHHQDSDQAISKPQKQQASKGWRERLPDKLLKTALAHNMAAARNAGHLTTRQSVQAYVARLLGMSRLLRPGSKHHACDLDRGFQQDLPVVSSWPN